METTPTTLDLPRGHMAIAVPETLPLHAITSQAAYTLARLRNGEFLAELDDDLKDLVKQVAFSNKKGTITIKLTVNPGRKGTVEVEDTIDAKPPKPEAGSTMLFATDGGQLLDRDPQQMELFDKVTPIHTAPKAESKPVLPPKAANQ